MLTLPQVLGYLVGGLIVWFWIRPFITRLIKPTNWEELGVEFNSGRHPGHHPDGFCCPKCRTYFPKEVWVGVSGNSRHVSATPLKSAVVTGWSNTEVCIWCWNGMHGGETI